MNTIGVQTITQIEYKNGSTVTDTDVVRVKTTPYVTTTITDSTRHIESKGTTLTIDSSSHTVTEDYNNSGTLTWYTTLTPPSGPPTTIQGQQVLDPSGTNKETVTTTYAGGSKKVETTTWSEETGGANNATQQIDEYDEHGALTGTTAQQVDVGLDGGWGAEEDHPGLG